MGSLSCLFQRPVVAASAVALASVSTDLRDKFWPYKPDSSQQSNWMSDLISETRWALISDCSVSQLYSTKTPINLPNLNSATIQIGKKC